MVIAALAIYNMRNERNKHDDDLQYPDTENGSYILWLDLLISLGILNKLCRLCLSQFRKLKNPFLAMTRTSIELGLGYEVNRSLTEMAFIVPCRRQLV